MPIPARTLFILMILSGLPALVSAQSSTLTGSSRSMNPAISVNGLIRGQVSRDNPTGDLNGFKLDGVELQFTSVVDPFWKANFKSVFIRRIPTTGKRTATPKVWSFMSKRVISMVNPCPAVWVCGLENSPCLSASTLRCTCTSFPFPMLRW